MNVQDLEKRISSTDDAKELLHLLTDVDTLSVEVQVCVTMI